MHFSAAVAGILAATIVTAHPGHDVQAEAAERRAMLGMMTRSDLSHCADKIKERGLEARSIARRSALVSDLLKKAGKLGSRDVGSVLNKTHHSAQNYTLATPPEVLFASNNSCILSPEVTEGPYYVAGEYIRQNVIEKQPGVGMVLDLQVLDIETCDPVSNAYLEIWHCNSTGVYSGVAAGGNGDGDASNIHATFLRGLQKTDADGVAIFETLFPGHYEGRTNHIHVMVHHNATARSNHTVLDLTATHVGQVYFDQDLVYKVEATSVYKANKQTLTLNKQDGILAEGAKTSDPIVQYVELGDTIEDGLLAWIAFGVNTTLARSVHAAVTLTEDGGVPNEDVGFPGGPGGPGGPPPGFTGFPPGGPGAPVTSEISTPTSTAT